MAIFTKSDPAAQAQRDLDAAHANRDNLTERLRVAGLAFSERRVEAVKLARNGGTDAALDAAESKLRAAEDRISTLNDALADFAQQIAALEKAVADHTDKKTRQATAATIEALGARLEKSAKSFDAAVAELADVCAALSPVIIDAAGLAQFAASVRTETPPAIALIMGIIKNRIAATLAGNAPASLPREPEAPPVSKLVASSPTKTIFLLHAVKFRDAVGMQQCVQKLNMLSLPLALAECALEFKHAIETVDPRCRKMNQTFGAIAPHPDHCIDLDALLTGIASTTPSPRTNVFRDFEALDRGPPIAGTMKTQRAPEPMSASRTLPPDATKK